MTKAKEEINNYSLVSGELTNSKWDELVNVIQAQFHYDNNMRERMIGNKLLKLVAAIPFVAGSDNPSRTAIIHMSAMMIAGECGKEIFLHKFHDNSSLKKRLHAISNFDGGNQDIINKGMNLLYLVMLSDYQIDSKADEKISKYNPLNSSIWDYKKLRDQILEECNTIPVTQLDTILSANEACKTPWEYGLI